MFRQPSRASGRPQSAAAGGGGSWAPSDLGSALRLWIKADAGITSSGGLISQANDQSGNGFHLFSTGTNRPTLNATGYNSLPSIDFAASSSTWLGTQAIGGAAVPVGLNLGTSCSFFFIGRYTTASDGFGRIMSYLGPTTSAGSGVDYAAADCLGAMHRNGSANAFQGTQNSVDLAVGAATPSSNIRALMVYDGAAHTAQLYINNSASGSGSTGVAAFNLGSTGCLAIGTTIQTASGNISTIAANFTGTIAELLVTNTALDTTTRGNLDAYVVARLGA